MDAKKLEELLAGCSVTNWGGVSEDYEALRDLAPSLARRVIAAEALLKSLGEALSDVEENGRYTVHWWVDDARDALVAYREASK